MILGIIEVWTVGTCPKSKPSKCPSCLRVLTNSLKISNTAPWLYNNKSAR